MHKKLVGIVLLLTGIVALAACTETIKFEGPEFFGNPLTLKGSLQKPEGEGPFPAVVLLHGASGVNVKRNHDWVLRLKRWGYVTLLVDSFGPRGAGSSHHHVVVPEMRAQDAYAAKRYLANLPFVDHERIGLMGWSHGGWSVLWALSNRLPPEERSHPFQAAVAFYPRCDVYMNDLNAPLLILIGELDETFSAQACSGMTPPEGESAHEVKLKVYPGAYHCFDWAGLDIRDNEGRKLKYSPRAAADAEIQVKNFLLKYLQ